MDKIVGDLIHHLYMSNNKKPTKSKNLLMPKKEGNPLKAMIRNNSRVENLLLRLRSVKSMWSSTESLQSPNMLKKPRKKNQKLC